MNRLHRAIRALRENRIGKPLLSMLQRLYHDLNEKLIIDISDEYVNWLCFANSGMLLRGNLYCIDFAIRNLPTNDPIIEIGSFCGLSTNLISYYKERNKARNPLITCDRWEFEGGNGPASVGESSISHAEYREFVKETFRRNVSFFSKFELPFTFEMVSDEFFQAWKELREASDVFGRTLRLGGPISFCYIDGNHSYDYALRDFLNSDDFLVPGGFILFDDSADGSGWEVCRVVTEVLNSKRYDLVIKNPNYFFRKK